MYYCRRCIYDIIYIYTQTHIYMYTIHINYMICIICTICIIIWSQWYPTYTVWVLIHVLVEGIQRFGCDDPSTCDFMLECGTCDFGPESLIAWCEKDMQDPAHCAKGNLAPFGCGSTRQRTVLLCYSILRGFLILGVYRVMSFKQ